MSGSEPPVYELPNRSTDCESTTVRQTPVYEPLNDESTDRQTPTYLTKRSSDSGFHSIEFNNSSVNEKENNSPVNIFKEFDDIVNEEEINLPPNKEQLRNLIEEAYNQDVDDDEVIARYGSLLMNSKRQLLRNRKGSEMRDELIPQIYEAIFNRRSNNCSNHRSN